MDYVTDHMINNEESGLKIFLTQNNVSGETMTLAYRQLSLKNYCFNKCICHLVNTYGQGKCSDISFDNKLGGGIPTDFAICPTDEYINFSDADLTEKLYSLPFSSCKFETTTDTMRKLYTSCNSHAKLKNEIFDKSLEKLILQDIDRKTVGYFSKQVREIRAEIVELTHLVMQFISCSNGIFGQLCTLQNVD